MKFAILSKKVGYFLTVSNVVSIYRQNLRLKNLKIRTVTNAKILVFIFVEAITHFLLYNLYDCPFKDMQYIIQLLPFTGF